MGWYSRFVVPRLLEKSMANPALHHIRKELLSHANGKVLEVGIGSGENLAHYPEHVTKLCAVDANPGFNRVLRTHIAASRIRVHHTVASIEALPYPDETFDTVVSTWTLCSIRNIDKALAEVRRVLKPGGILLFVEHGLHTDRRTRFVQHVLTPFWKIYKGGCRLNRDMASIVIRNGFTVVECSEFDLPTIKRFAQHQYQGVARKPTETTELSS